MTTRTLRRYEDGTRMNHWAVALLFFCAALSGLAFFHPSLYFLTMLFGGGPWARILHPFFGVLMVIGFLLLYARVWRENVWAPRDREWLNHASDMLAGDKASLPAAGKYNAGQKLIFWIMVGSLFLLLVTGFMFWSPWFVGYFPITLRRIAVVLHAASAVVLVLSVTVHVYAAIWVKGTMQAMTRGTVSEGWARQNHALWHQEVTRGKPQ